MKNIDKLKELTKEITDILNEENEHVVKDNEPVLVVEKDKEVPINKIYSVKLVKDSVDTKSKTVEVDVEYESYNNMLIVAIQEQGGDWGHFYRYEGEQHKTSRAKKRVKLSYVKDVDVNDIMLQSFLTTGGWENRTSDLNQMDIKSNTSITNVSVNTKFYRGPNIAGGAFGHSDPATSKNFNYNRPGGYGVQSFELKYWIKEKKASVIRIPVGWERIQPELNGELNYVTVNELKKNIDEILSLGSNVIIDLHNYLRFTTTYKTTMTMNGEFNPSHMYDIWKKISAIWADSKYKDRVIMNLMNEPHTIGQDILKESMIQAVRGVRDSGNKTLVLISGNLYSSFAHFTSSANNGHSWTHLNQSSSDIFEGFEVYDSSNNWAVDLHHYTDADGAGKGMPLLNGDVNIAEKQGVNTLKWARFKPDGSKRNEPYKIFIGEFGMPLLSGNDLELFVQSMKNQIKYMENNKDVFIGYTLWSAGISWPLNYNLGLDPEWSGGISVLQQNHGKVLQVHSQNVRAVKDGVTMSRIFEGGTF